MRAQATPASLPASTRAVFFRCAQPKTFAPYTPVASGMNDGNSMLLTLDVGNTNTVLGLYRFASDELITHWRVSTLRTQTADEYGVLFLNLFAMRKVEASEVSAIIISSVVPPLESTLRQVCERYFNLKPMFVEPGIKTGMPILVDNPTEVGADRLVNSVAAFARYGGPCIVVDFGTATTFDMVSAKGEYLGGAIAPGLAISAEALFARAARLSRVDVKETGQGGRHQYGRSGPERAVLRLHRPGGWHTGAHCERDGGPGLAGSEDHCHRRPGPPHRR